MNTQLINFPHPNSADEHGIVHLGGELTIENLINSYKMGIFPWPYQEDFPMVWYSPNPRGVLFIDNFIVNKSFKKFINKTNFTTSFNKSFREVVSKCQKNKVRTESSWITEKLINGYERLAQAGHAYSLEVWDQQILVGGLYGVKINNFYSAESMFYERSNASKYAIYSLLEHLKSQTIKWVDIQMVTPITEQLGGIEIERDKFLKLLSHSL